LNYTRAVPTARPDIVPEPVRWSGDIAASGGLGCRRSSLLPRRAGSRLARDSGSGKPGSGISRDRRTRQPWPRARRHAIQQGCTRGQDRQGPLNYASRPCRSHGRARHKPHCRHYAAPSARQDSWASNWLETSFPP